MPDLADRSRLLTSERVILFGEGHPLWYLGERVNHQYDGLLLLSVSMTTMMNMNALVRAVERGAFLRASYHNFLFRGRDYQTRILPRWAPPIKFNEA